MNHLVRKREKEGRRRMEFKEAFQNLTKTLLKFDEDFSREHEQREQSLASTRSVSKSKKKKSPANDDDLFSRIELVNQAIFTITRLHENITEYRKNLEDFGSGRKTMMDIIKPPKKKRKVCYHHGIGPVAPDVEPETIEEAQNAQETQLLTNALGPNVALGPMPLLSTNSSFASIQQHDQQRQQLLDQIQLQESQKKILASQLSTNMCPSVAFSSAFSQTIQGTAGQNIGLPSTSVFHGRYSPTTLPSESAERCLSAGTGQRSSLRNINKGKKEKLDGDVIAKNDEKKM